MLNLIVFIQLILKPTGQEQLNHSNAWNTKKLTTNAEARFVFMVQDSAINWKRSIKR